MIIQSTKIILFIVSDTDAIYADLLQADCEQPMINDESRQKVGRKKSRDIGAELIEIEQKN